MSQKKQVFPNNPKANQVFNNLRKIAYILDHIDEELKPVVKDLMSLVETTEQFKPQLEQLILEAENGNPQEFISVVSQNIDIVEQFREEYESSAKQAFEEDYTAINEAKGNLSTLDQDIRKLENSVSR